MARRIRRAVVDRLMCNCEYRTKAKSDFFFPPELVKDGQSVTLRSHDFSSNRSAVAALFTAYEQYITNLQPESNQKPLQNVFESDLFDNSEVWFLWNRYKLDNPTNWP